MFERTSTTQSYNRNHQDKKNNPHRKKLKVYVVKRYILGLTLDIAILNVVCEIIVKAHALDNNMVSNLGAL